MATPTTPQICYVSCKQNQHLKPPQSSHHCVSQLFCHTFAKSVRSRASSKHVPRTTEFIPAIPAEFVRSLRWDHSRWLKKLPVLRCQSLHVPTCFKNWRYTYFFQNKHIYTSSILGEMLTKLCMVLRWYGMKLGKTKVRGNEYWKSSSRSAKKFTEGKLIVRICQGFSCIKH